MVWQFQRQARITAMMIAMIPSRIFLASGGGDVTRFFFAATTLNPIDSK
jgi:hypothetical protein